MKLRIAIAFVCALVFLAIGALAQVSPILGEKPTPMENSQVPGNAETVLQTFQTVHIHSDTIYLKTETMGTALQQRPEFNAWSLVLAAKPEEAEVNIEITRPFLTFDWKFNMVHRKTQLGLGSGKIVAWDGKTAGPKLAAEIVKRIQTVRSLPVSLPDAEKGGPSESKGALRCKRWKAKTAQDGIRLTIVVDQNSIVGQTKNAVFFSIPVRSVVAVTHSTEVTGISNLAGPWWNFWSNADWSEGDPSAAGTVLLSALVVGGILEGIEELGKRKHHFVRIDWMENGSVIGETFKVSSSKYKPLLAELQQVTQKEWKDLPKRLEAVRNDPKP